MSALARFVVEALFLVLVIAAAGVAGLAVVWIGLALLAAWLLVALVEIVETRRGEQRRRRAAEALRAAPMSLPELDPTTLIRREDATRALNLWDLEQMAERLDGDGRTEERALLLVHLRDFADPAGNLPREFDVLVREAFGTASAEAVT